MQSVYITTDVVSSNLDQDEVYNIKRLWVICDRSVIFSCTNIADRHQTIKQTNIEVSGWDIWCFRNTNKSIYLNETNY